MDCEIVTIGSELLLGRIIDTNASYLSRKLNLIGLNIAFHTTVGDNYTQRYSLSCIGENQSRYYYRWPWAHRR